MIDWRESYYTRLLCSEIESYGQLRRKWFIGPIQCKPRLPKICKCQPGCFFVKVFAYYWDLEGERRKVFLGYSVWSVIPQRDSIKNAIQYQTNPSHTLSVCGMSLG